MHLQWLFLLYETIQSRPRACCLLWVQDSGPLGPLRPLVQGLYLKSVTIPCAGHVFASFQSPEKVDLLTHSFSEII